MTSMISHLVQVEVGGVQSYIFDGSRLRGWRGASALLDYTERAVIPEVLSETYGEAVRPLRQGGGVVLLGLEEKALGGERGPGDVADTVEQAYRAHAPGSRVYSAFVPFDPEDVAASLSALTFQVTGSRNRNPKPDSEKALLGALARPCGSCGGRPAETDSEIGDDGTLLCPVCAEKASHGRQVRGGQQEGSVLARFANYLGANHAEEGLSEKGLSKEDLSTAVPEDLSAIAEVGSGSIALIQADGNSLGKTIQQIQTRKQYEALSEGLAEAVQAAVFDTLSNCGPRPEGAASGTLPWEIIFLGGDDVLLATADDIALDVARELTRRIEARTEDLFGEPPLDTLGRSRLTMGTGVVVADPHVPMAVLRKLAHGLERSAKDRTYKTVEEEGREVSTFDFHRITGSGSASLSHIRNHVLRPRRTTTGYEASLTQRPFTVEELGRVVSVAERWKDLPGNKLQSLRESLFESPAQAMRQWTHVVARAPERRRGTWQALRQLVNHNEPAKPNEPTKPSGDGPSGKGSTGEEARGGETRGEERAGSGAMPFAERASPAGEGPQVQAETPLLDVLDARALLPD